MSAIDRLAILLREAGAELVRIGAAPSLVFAIECELRGSYTADGAWRDDA